MATLASLLVEIGIDTDELQAGAAAAGRALKNVGAAAVGVGVGIPVIAAVAAGAGAMAAAFAGAGAAVSAFKLAAQPQLDAVADASASAEAASKAHEDAALKVAKAEKLAAKGGDAYKSALREAKSATDAAKDADAAYEAQLAKLPPATRTMAKELQGLKDDHEKWSESLSSSTMPVFTQGIQLLRKLLPALTPLVQAGARAFSTFLKGINPEGIKGFIDAIGKNAEKNLTSLLNGIKNIAVGIGGIIVAFTGMSDNMSGGFESMTKSFADWGQSLGSSEGFATFVQLAKDGAATLGTLATAAGNLLVALSPLIGITAQLATYLAQIINAMPPEVLTAIATGFVAVSLGMKAWALGASIVTAANTIMASSTFLAIRGWIQMAAWAAWAYIQIAAQAVWSATTTAAAWLGNALKSIAIWVAQVVWAAIVATAQFAWMAIKAVAWAVVMAAQWFIALGPIGWAMALIIAIAALVVAKWDTVKSWTGKVWSWISDKVMDAIRSAKDAVVKTTAQIVDTIKGIKDSVVSAVSGAGKWLWDAGKNVVMGFINGLVSMFGAVKDKLGSLTSMLPDWKGPMALDKRILTPNGKAVLDSFMNGIDAQTPALRRQLQGITSDLPGMGMNVNPGGVAASRNSARNGLVLDVTGADEDMKRLIRRIVKNEGRGSVQTAFGTR